MDKSYLTPCGHKQRENDGGGSSADHEPRFEVHDAFFSTYSPTQPVSATGQGQERIQKWDMQPKPCRITLCFDGTGNKFHGDDRDSNVLKIYRMLDRVAGDQCKCYSLDSFKFTKL